MMTKTKRTPWTDKVVYRLGDTHEAHVSKDGTRWRLIRKSKNRNTKRKWLTVGAGTIVDDDPEFAEMLARAVPETPLKALRVGLGLQRAIRLYQSPSKAPETPLRLPITPEA